MRADDVIATLGILLDLATDTELRGKLAELRDRIVGDEEERKRRQAERRRRQRERQRRRAERKDADNE
jgi:hypothetical protein